MKKAITVGVDEKGAAKLLAGPDIPFVDQRKKFSAMRTGALPKGIASVEFYVREGYTFGVDTAAQKLRENGHIIDVDGVGYPPEVYQARLEWRANDGAERRKAEAEKRPYKPTSEIPTKRSDLSDAPEDSHENAYHFGHSPKAPTHKKKE